LLCCLCTLPDINGWIAFSFFLSCLQSFHLFLNQHVTLGTPSFMIKIDPWNILECYG
jgi:hypothetical protein